MKRSLLMIIGVLLILASLAGLVICIGGIYLAWQTRGTLVANVNQTLSLLETTLKATGDALVVANESLDTAGQSVDALSETIRTTGRSVTDTGPMIDALSQLTTEDLPQTIRTTQGALEAAQSSARVIDSTLRVVTAIPLLPVEPYNPQVPLSVSLGEVSQSLEPLPESLRSMQSSLTTARSNLDEIGGQFDTIATDVTEINASLTNAKDVIGQYQQVVGTLQAQLAQAKGGLPNLVNSLAWLFTIVLVWLGLTQVGLLMQGFEMIGMGLIRPEKQVAVRLETPSEPVQP
jgi:methyl-accepting chemotaxis protein